MPKIQREAKDAPGLLQHISTPCWSHKLHTYVIGFNNACKLIVCHYGLAQWIFLSRIPASTVSQLLAGNCGMEGHWLSLFPAEESVSRRCSKHNSLIAPGILLSESPGLTSQKSYLQLQTHCCACSLWWKLKIKQLSASSSVVVQHQKPIDLDKSNYVQGPRVTLSNFWNSYFTGFSNLLVLYQ